VAVFDQVVNEAGAHQAGAEEGDFHVVTPIAAPS
jgi:hypothetical protein